MYKKFYYLQLGRKNRLNKGVYSFFKGMQLSETLQQQNKTANI